MTYALAWPLQRALFQRLSDDAALSALVGPRIYDAPPPFEGGAAPEGLYVTLGDEEVADWGAADTPGATHTVTLSVHAPRRGFAEAKEAAGAICDALLGPAPALSRGRIVAQRFLGARTARAEGGALRRIDLRFRITVEDL